MNIHHPLIMTTLILGSTCTSEVKVSVRINAKGDIKSKYDHGQLYVFIRGRDITRDLIS